MECKRGRPACVNSLEKRSDQMARILYVLPRSHCKTSPLTLLKSAVPGHQKGGVVRRGRPQVDGALSAARIRLVQDHTITPRSHIESDKESL